LSFHSFISTGNKSINYKYHRINTISPVALLLLGKRGDR